MRLRLTRPTNLVLCRAGKRSAPAVRNNTHRASPLQRYDFWCCVGRVSEAHPPLATTPTAPTRDQRYDFWCCVGRVSEAHPPFETTPAAPARYQRYDFWSRVGRVSEAHPPLETTPAAPARYQRYDFVDCSKRRNS
ncbi:hypothetical protein [Cronobacter sakazakii]|uniref:hypothetical protein n=1 Tax=Cronobacter sakazakii TaxID=28141 RepID=UPI00111324F2|nr:hypothetical protein [Cronobacter sakazakii]